MLTIKYLLVTILRLTQETILRDIQVSTLLTMLSSIQLIIQKLILANMKNFIKETIKEITRSIMKVHTINNLKESIQLITQKHM